MNKIGKFYISMRSKSTKNKDKFKIISAKILLQNDCIYKYSDILQSRINFNFYQIIIFKKLIEI